MLKYILLFIIIYMLIRFFRRMSILFSRSESGSGSHDSQRRGGSFITDTRKRKKKYIPKDEGDYVDYEEIE